MEGKLRKVLVFLLVVAIGLNTTGMSVFAEEAKVQEGWDGITTQSVYEGDNYKVTYSLASQWDGGYNANIKIENTGESVIENWYLEYDSANEIANIWNAEIDSQESGRYIIKNAGWNADIAVGGSIEFGFGGSGNFSGFPEEYSLIGESKENKKEDYTIDK